MKHRPQSAALSSPIHEQLIFRVQDAKEQALKGDFAACIRTCEPLVKALPRRSEMHLEMLSLLGLAHGMLKQYQQSYNIFSEGIALDPARAEFWHNHGLACYYMARIAEAVQDFERAVELTKHDTSEMARKMTLQLQETRRELREAMLAHGSDITIELYREREESFTRAVNLTRQEKWQEAEALFRQLTETGSGVPSYWGNLGVCLMMQHRYAEAEEVFKQALKMDPDYPIARDNLRKMPEIRRLQGPIALKVLNSSAEEGEKQSLNFYEKNEAGEVISQTVIERSEDSVISTRSQLGMQPPRYDLSLNPYRDTRLTTCPRCEIKTRARKFSLVVHVHPYDVIVDKMCRFCDVCGLLVVHQDQLEKYLVAQFTVIDPKAIGRAYQVIGTLDRAEWDREKQDPLTFEQLQKYLHDFKKWVEFRRVPVEQ